ncbi:hypothetical protein ES703_125208 [subsurface metagenome]
MGRTPTPERQKLKRCAIRLRQELGWSIDKIVVHLSLPHTTIQHWLDHNSTPKGYHNNAPLSLNTVHIVVDNNNCTHHWIIDSDTVGRCRYCLEVRDFGRLLQREGVFAIAGRRGAKARKKVLGKKEKR